MTAADRIAALSRAVDLAEDRLDASAIADATGVLDRIEGRAERAPDATVVALMGATGSGKSTLFNAIIGEEVATAAATRPTTREPMSISWAENAGELLDWLGVGQRHEREPDGTGLVLLDLPDIDSTEARNRETAARLSEVVDALVWVLDPQKYADAVVHNEFLAPLAANAEVMIVVLNQVDRLGPEREEVLRNLHGLLARDGLSHVTVLATSARTGEGVPELRDRITQLARSRRARLERTLGEITRGAAALRAAADGAPEISSVRVELERVEEAAANAAGVPVVVDAARTAYMQRARRHIGWVPVRWVGRLRPNALARLHLDRRTRVTSAPAASHVQSATLRSAAIEMISTATRDLPDEWRTSVAESARSRVPEAITGLDAAIGAVDYGTGRTPGWWRGLNVLQWLAFLTAVLGGGWLVALGVLDYLRMPQPPLPMVGDFPLPTVLLVGGVLLGILLAVLGTLAARAAAGRLARRVRRELSERVSAVVGERLVEPLETELEDYRLFRESLSLAERS